MGVFELGNPEGKGAQAVLEIQVLGGGGQKTMPSVGGGVDFFWNNPMCLTWPWFRRFVAL